ncbi:unnamed protein product [Rodentolepis nana]|uniref:BK_channel_a domain-containing protein n=1 Tax=Rodentolepis nana TaxID=102285 RepID=A0A0R3TD42_RODNA|nr:unnamed protein product [Rodentolepis nana]
MLAQLTEAQKQPRNKGTQNSNVGKEENTEETEQIDQIQVVSKLSSSDQKRDDPPAASTEGKEGEEGEKEKEDKAALNPTPMNLTKPCILRIPFANSTQKKLAYSLAFSTMKYCTVLEKIQEDVGFYGEYPDLREEDHLVLVTLYDYSVRNFQLRTSTDLDADIPPLDEAEASKPRFAGRTIIYPPSSKVFQEVEEAIVAMSVKFSAAIARIRVKEQVKSLRLLLPLEWRDAETKSENMPFYGWYNLLLGTSEVTLTWLKENNFTHIRGRLPTAMEFGDDEDCSDVFIFNHADRATIMDSPIVRDQFLFVQDRSNIFVLHCLMNFIGAGEEVILINQPNSLCGIHLEGLLMNRFPYSSPVPTIRIVRSVKESEDSKLAVKSGCKSIRLITDDFLSLNPNAESYRGIRHIIIESTDMKSGVVNPIDYVDFENEDLSVLKDMWTKNDDPQKVTKRLTLLKKNEAYLKHALRFNQARTVIFISHSEDLEETEKMVLKCVDYVNRTIQREILSAIPSSKAPPPSTPGFVIRLPTAIPSLRGFEYGENNALTSPFVTPSGCIRFKSTKSYNGFFIACLKKEVNFLLYFLKNYLN